MERVADERRYVLLILHRMHEEVVANPGSFDIDAQLRIDEAIALLQLEEDQAHAT